MPKPSSLRLVLVVAVAVLASSLVASPASSTPDGNTMTAVLQRLGGEQCPDGSAFTCVTVPMPLDHFNPADQRTIDVVFAVLPATGERKGMFVTAVGGPGASGLGVADFYTSAFLAPRITERFDIVFFDQRGIGRSGGLACPQAASAWYGGGQRAVTPEEEAALKRAARTFASDCVTEFGPEAEGLLPYLGTDQAIEDLEAFRRVVGDTRIWLYGESYGTQYAQTYAADHGDHVAGLLLDGTVDLTTGGTEYFAEQAVAFGTTLEAALRTCNQDPTCARELGGDAVVAYDRLAARLQQGDISFSFPKPSGGSAPRRFSLANLEAVAGASTYGEGDRMRFSRALAAWASRHDLVPLARLAYAALGLDPETLAIIPDAGFSDGMYFAVDCRDYSYPGRDADARAENYVRAGDEVEAESPRLASVFGNELPCAYWPAAVIDLERPDPLVAKGIPTIVLGGTADPATPYHQAVDVYHRLNDGYLITKTGGPHIIFGRGDPCVDEPVTDFLVQGRVPPQRETACRGVLAEDYVALAPEWAADFENQLAAFTSLETELNQLPEYLDWDGVEPTEVGCPSGGTLRFAPDGKDGEKEALSFSRCTFTRGFTVTGAGTYDPEADDIRLNLTTDGRWDCRLRYRRTAEQSSVSGPCRTDGTS